MFNPIKLTDEDRQLVEQNIGLVVYAINHFGHQGVTDPDDAFQVGMIGLMKAVANYDKEGEAKLSTFAMPCIINELRKESQMQRRQRRGGGMVTVSLDRLIDGSNGDCYLDSLVSDEPSVEEQVEQAELHERLFHRLSKMHTSVARMAMEYLFHDATQAEIAKRYGTTQSNVSRQITLLLRRLHNDTLERGGAGV